VRSANRTPHAASEALIREPAHADPWHFAWQASLDQDLPARLLHRRHLLVADRLPILETVAGHAQLRDQFACRQTKKPAGFGFLERKTRFELATFSLAMSREA